MKTKRCVFGCVFGLVLPAVCFCAGNLLFAQQHTLSFQGASGVERETSRHATIGYGKQDGRALTWARENRYEERYTPAETSPEIIEGYKKMAAEEVKEQAKAQAQHEQKLREEAVRRANAPRRRWWQWSRRRRVYHYYPGFAPAWGWDVGPGWYGGPGWGWGMGPGWRGDLGWGWGMGPGWRGGPGWGCGVGPGWHGGLGWGSRRFGRRGGWRFRSGFCW